MDRNVNIITDTDGSKIVLINDITFKGKRNVDWKNVENYLRQFTGEAFIVEESKEEIYIGNDFPDEYSNSNYTYRLKGASAKANANAAQGIPELIQIATNKEYESNRKEKHNKDARYGWYRYESRFALPVYDEYGKVERYNIYHVLMLMRHSQNGSLYMYDIMDIKKKRASFSNPKTLLSKRTRQLFFII